MPPIRPMVFTMTSTSKNKNALLSCSDEKSVSRGTTDMRNCNPLIAATFDRFNGRIPKTAMRAGAFTALARERLSAAVIPRALAIHDARSLLASESAYSSRSKPV